MSFQTRAKVTTNMSKRKGRKPPIHSEIKSVLRAPEELSESEGSEGATEPDADLDRPSSEAVSSPPDTTGPEELGAEDEIGAARRAESDRSEASAPDDEFHAPALDDAMMSDAADAVEAAGGFDVMEGFAEAIEDQELPRLVPDNLELGEPDDTESFL